MRPLLLGLLLLATIPATAEEARKVWHDGVEMALTKAGDNGLEIAYGAEVPANLRELGVTAGTMLVRGTWDDKLLVGEAWAFSPDCKSVPYPVFGMVDYGGALIVFGPVPRSCTAGGDASWGREAIMRFDPPAASPHATAVRGKRKQRESKPVEPPKPRAKPAPKPRAAPRAAPQPQQQWQQWPSYPQWWR